MNLHTKFIFPKKDYMDFLLLGIAIYDRFGSFWVYKNPYLEMMCPSNFPSKTTKISFLDSRIYYIFCTFQRYVLDGEGGLISSWNKV
jgi:hypothetical protein